MTTAVVPSGFEKIVELINRGIECWEKAGALLVKLIDEAGSSLDEVSDATGLSKDILVRFEQIGRKVLYPKLLSRCSPGSRALSRCSYSEQVEYCNQPVTVLLMEGDNMDKLQVGLDALTPNQVTQVFCRSHVRTMAEQRAYLEDQKQNRLGAALEQDAVDVPYKITRNKVTFQKGVSLGRSELASILARMS